MSNNGHQDILKYFKFVVFFVGRILGKQKNLFNINKLQEIFYPLGDAKEIKPLREIVRAFSLWGKSAPPSAPQILKKVCRLRKAKRLAAGAACMRMKAADPAASFPYMLLEINFFPPHSS